MSEELLRRTEHEGQSQSRSVDADPSTAEARKRQLLTVSMLCRH